MRDRSRRRVSAAVAVVGATAALGAVLLAQRSAAPTGIYSDLAYRADGGDLVGMEVFLVAGPGGYFATVQCAGGEPGRPAVVPVELEGERLAFRLEAPQPDCDGAFVGELSSRGLRGRFDGETGDRWLPRRASYWQGRD